MTGDRTLQRLIPALLLCTGCTGLVYEVVLGRMLSLHLGSSGASQAITLATFLGGMALGAALCGVAQRGILQRTPRPLLAYAVLEAAIGLWAAALPEVTEAVLGTLEHWLTGRDAGDPLSLAAKLTACALVVLPLTTAMGATLPALAAGVERLQPAQGVQLVSRYYWLNAAGAAFGATLAGFVLVEALGLAPSLYAGAVVNLLVAVAAWWFGRRQLAVDGRGSGDTATGSDDAPIGRFVLAAFLTGFVALLAEVLWTRAVALWLGASVYAFALMLAVTITGIATGSGIAARLIGRGVRPAVLLAWTQAGAAVCAVGLMARLDGATLQLMHTRMRLVRDPDNYPLWLVLSAGIVALHLLPAALCLGASFPALLASARAAGARVDRAAARILAANTLGNLLGSLSGGFVVMPWLGMAGALLASAAASLAVAALVAQRPWTRAGQGGWALAALVAALVAILNPHKDEALTKGLFRLHPPADKIDPGARLWSNVAGHIELRIDGKDVTVTVESFAGNHLSYATNGKPEGGTGDVPTQLLLGLDGYIAVPHAKDALVIGLGTGQSAAAVAAKADVRVHVVELSAPVLEAAALFKDLNDDILHNPRVQITIADAREVLRSLPPHSLDLVVSEPSNPWVAGVADLFTVEAFERIATRLRKGGALVQWIQRYEMSDATFRSILCTLHTVMPHMALFRTMPGDLVVVASPWPLQPDLQAARAVFDSPAVRAYVGKRQGDYVPDDLPQLLINQLAGSQALQTYCGGFSQALSERRPRLEFSAPRDVFAHANAEATQLLLDTRLGNNSDTWLADLQKQSPLSGAERKGLLAYLKRSAHKGDAPVQLALAAELPAEVSATLAALPADPPTGAKEASAWCQWLVRAVPALGEAQATVVGPVVSGAKATAWLERCTQGDIAGGRAGLRVAPTKRAVRHQP